MWVTPVDVIDEELITVAAWNQNLVDNVVYLANPPVCILRDSDGQTIANSTETTLNFDTEVADAWGMHSAGTPSRITIGVRGNYVISATVSWASGAGTSRYIRIVKNGSATILKGLRRMNTTATLTQTLTGVVNLAAGDYITCVVHQNSGGDLAVDDFDNLPRFSAVWVSDNAFTDPT